MLSRSLTGLLIIGCASLLAWATASAAPSNRAETGWESGREATGTDQIEATTTPPDYRALPRVERVPPARFAGWFQPWAVSLLFALPVVGALIERRRDVNRFLRARAWRERIDPDP